MPRKVPKENWDNFIIAFAESGNVKLAAKTSGIASSTVRLRLDSDEEFRRRCAEAEQSAVDLLEAEAWRRAVKGVRAPIISHGKRVGYIRRYSDALLISLLRAHRPHKFNNRGVPAAVIPDKVESARERIARRLARLAARKGGGSDPPRSDGGASGGA
jgi:hypothetical protein